MSLADNMKNDWRGPRKKASISLLLGAARGETGNNILITEVDVAQTVESISTTEKCKSAYSFALQVLRAFP
jgi:hypothetical protein